MILLDEDLEKYLGPTYKNDIGKMRDRNQIYSDLNSIRNKYCSNKYGDIDKYVLEAEAVHKKTQEFIESINKNEIEEVKKFLGEQNLGAEAVKDSKTICLMDATSSMGKLLNQAKNTVGIMFTRAQTILKEYNIPPNCF